MWKQSSTVPSSLADALSPALYLGLGGPTYTPSPQKSNGHGKLSGQRKPAPRGDPGSAGPPTDQLCPSVGFCSMERCQNPQPTPRGNRFMSPGGKGGAAKVAGSLWRGIIRRDPPPPARGVPGILPFKKNIHKAVQNFALTSIMG